MDEPKRKNTRPTTAGRSLTGQTTNVNTRPTTPNQRPPSASTPSSPPVARSPNANAYNNLPKRGLSEMASLLDAMEHKLKDNTVLSSSDGNAADEVNTSGTTKREFIDKSMGSVISELNMALDPEYRHTKPALGEEQVSYTLLHRALRELVKEKQMCASEVEDMRSKVLEKEATLVADLHHANAMRDAITEKLRNTELAYTAAQQHVNALRHKKQVYKDSLKEEKENGEALMKQKLNAENMLDVANAHIASLTKTASVYEAKLQEATEKLMGLTKQKVKLENKNNVEVAAFESKIANLSKVNAERKESLERATAELSDMSRQNQVLRTQLAAAQTQLNHLTQRLADRHQSDLKAMQASKRNAREREKERERDKIDPPTGMVTLVFTDVQGSTAQWEANPEIMTIALDVHFKIMREHMNRAGGYECKTEGDAFMIAFQSPLQAVHWCMFVQEALLVADWPPALLQNEHSQEERSPDGRLLFRGLRVRIGAHTGTPQCHPDPVSKRMDYFGPMVNRAARVSGLAHGGQVVVSGRTWREIERDISGVDIVHMGEHSLKGIKGKEQIVQLLPATLAGRKFPPLVSSEAQKSHFEEQRSSPLASTSPIMHPFAHNAPGASSVPLLPGGTEEEEGAELSSPTYQVAPAFAKMRELSLAIPESTAQAEIVMAVNEAEKQLRIAMEEISELKISHRSLLDRVADTDERMETYDELEAEAAEWREMVDKLTAERQELEELVKAEQTEKEFFLRKLMENKDAQSLNTVPSYTQGKKKETDFQISDIVAMTEKEKIEALLRASSKIKTLRSKIKNLQDEKSGKPDDVEAEKAQQKSPFEMASGGLPAQQDSQMFKTVQQVLQQGQTPNPLQQSQNAQNSQTTNQQNLQTSQHLPNAPNSPGMQHAPSLAQQHAAGMQHAPSLAQQHAAGMQHAPSLAQQHGLPQVQSFSIASHAGHGSSSRLINPASTDLYHKQITQEQEKQIHIMSERNKTLEQVISKLGVDHTAKIQSSQNHIASLLQRLADAEKALADAQSKSDIKPEFDTIKRVKENEALRHKLKEVEEELEKVSKGKEELAAQWKDLVEPVLMQKPTTNTAAAKNKKPVVDVPVLMKKLRTLKEKVDALEAEKRENESKGRVERDKERVGGRIGSPRRETPRDKKDERRMKKEESKEGLTKKEEGVAKEEGGRKDETPRDKKDERRLKKEESKEGLTKKEEGGRKEETPKEDSVKEKKEESANKVEDIKEERNAEETKASEKNDKIEKGEKTEEAKGENSKVELSKSENSKVEISKIENSKGENAKKSDATLVDKDAEEAKVFKKVKSLESQLLNLESENEIIVQENYRLVELVEQLEAELKAHEQKITASPTRPRRTSVASNAENAPARRGSLAAPNLEGGARRSSLVLDSEGQAQRRPDAEGHQERPQRRASILPDADIPGRRASVSISSPALEPAGGDTLHLRARRNSINPPTTPVSSSKYPIRHETSATSLGRDLPTNATSSSNLLESMEPIFEPEGPLERPVGRARSSSDPPNLRVSFHKQAGPTPIKEEPRKSKEELKKNLSVVTPPSPNTSPQQSPTQPALLTPIAPRTPNSTKSTTGWSQMAADMEQELEELTGLISNEKPTTPKPLTRSTSKNQFTLDNLFAKKGQQYLTPIMQKSKQAQQLPSGPHLGLSGRSFV